MNNFEYFCKNYLMKKLFIFLILLGLGPFSYSQSQSIELETYCFGNKEHNLISKLSPHSLNQLEKVLQKNNVDTSFFYRVRYDEVFSKYTTKDYLSKHTYSYFNWNKSDQDEKINEFQKIHNDHRKQNKLIVLYSTNNKNIENLSIYVFQ